MTAFGEGNGEYSFLSENMTPEIWGESIRHESWSSWTLYGKNLKGFEEPKSSNTKPFAIDSLYWFSICKPFGKHFGAISKLFRSQSETRLILKLRISMCFEIPNSNVFESKILRKSKILLLCFLTHVSKCRSTREHDGRLFSMCIDESHDRLLRLKSCLKLTSKSIWTSNLKTKSLWCSKKHLKMFYKFVKRFRRCFIVESSEKKRFSTSPWK